MMPKFFKITVVAYNLKHFPMQILSPASQQSVQIQISCYELKKVLTDFVEKHAEYFIGFHPFFTDQTNWGRIMKLIA